MTEYKEYIAWDATTRWFHWINAIAVVGLIVTGLVVLFDNELGLSTAGKITLKSVHVSFGYVMVLNLLWRFVWAFLGGHYSRWRSVLPGGPGYGASLRAYMASFASGEPQQYVGHNPLARIGVAILFLLLMVQLVTGLVIAGTDLFWPPFGHWFAAWVAAPGVDPTAVLPGSPELVDKASFDSMRAFRKPFVEVHEIGFYALVVTIILHLAAVVMTEIHEGGSITSAMFTGRKLLSRRPPDEF
ncbi:cytochrome b/b6 domain-containing protein [Hyphomicrobium sp. MC1]|uniref:cytochrome b/b6 domain-containing protein n=1 Tax=Hyphomicrobium sp. (strain MC1) TaxID=717785 RepID=UPI000213E1F5|nr:cytochrome b/b6 domain-containing protein [Hyphomicrobium sp. MC1]CCB66448.1 Cytochrome B561 [Hyphomicrobium sp. MC1]